MAILVTGVGYIGSALAKRLLASGEDVIAVENYFSTPRQAVATLAECSRFTLIEGSITDSSVLERAFRSAKIHTVFHLAAQASARPDAAPVAYTQETNFTGPRMLLDACAAHGVRRVVFASSMRLYRPPLSRRVSERSPIYAPDLVHLSQMYGELLLGGYRGRGFTGLSVRMGVVHGVGPVLKTDPRFLAVPQRFCLQAARREPLRAATGPASLLAFVHLDDVVEGLLRCADLRGGPTIANLAAEVRTVASVAQAVKAVAEDRGIPVRIQHDGRPRRYKERQLESALDATGFRPRRRLEDSLGDVLDSYLAMGAQCSSGRALSRLVGEG